MVLVDVMNTVYRKPGAPSDQFWKVQLPHELFARFPMRAGNAEIFKSDKFSFSIYFDNFVLFKRAMFLLGVTYAAVTHTHAVKSGRESSTKSERDCGDRPEISFSFFTAQTLFQVSICILCII
jgi:hypothetical protein